MLAEAIEAEVADWIDAHAHIRDEDGRRQVVRNGSHPERDILTGLGPIAVKQPRVLDRRAPEQRERFTPNVLPPYLRRTKTIDEKEKALQRTAEDAQNDFQTEMNRVVQGFVAQITELARRAAIDTLESSFGKGRGRGRLAGSVGRPRGKGAKRSSDELDKLSDQLVQFVKDNPGLRIEQINKQLGTTTKDLALPIRKLISEGALKTKGQKRSTTYTVGRKTWKN